MNSEHKCIYRRQTGWEIKIQHEGKCRYREMFADSIYGDFAIKIARTKRDLWLKENDLTLEDVNKHLIGRRGRVGRKPSTGFTGVSFVTMGQTQYYRASFRMANGRSKSVSFSVKKYGKEDALKMAIEARKDMEEEISLPTIKRQLNQKEVFERKILTMAAPKSATPLRNANLPFGISIHTLLVLEKKGLLAAKTINPDEYGSIVQFNLTVNGKARLHELNHAGLDQDE